MPNLSDVGVIRDLLSRNNFSFSKALGQNFLINPSVCPRMAEYAASEQQDGVIEIGPGIGVLTRELSRRFDRVLAFEVDERLRPILRETVGDCPNVEVVFRDVLTADLHEVIRETFGDRRVSVCANLPYYITSPILMYLLENRFPLQSVTVMVQKEAADRICAEVGTRQAGALTAAIHYYAQPEKLFSVSRGSFLPAPNVDSTVIRLKLRETPPVHVANEEAFFRLIRAAFGQRRKTAANSVSSGLGIPKAVVEDVLRQIGLSPSVRAETFTLEQFSALDAVLSDRND
jgi:16S rRNA (adenine1518-N6/adenine1519-N6)-dimethyltransferase